MINDFMISNKLIIIMFALLLTFFIIVQAYFWNDLFLNHLIPWIKRVFYMQYE
jgi:hypothetical protein